MGSQTSKCVCCKCKDCKCQIITEKNGGYWAPAPKVVCNKNSVHGRYIFKDSCDCGGDNCEIQEGCAVSKLCLTHTYRFKVRVWGQLEAWRSGFHRGKIEYRKISCSKREGWKTLVEVKSEGGGEKCCVKCVKKVCDIKLARGKYEFKFTATSVDGVDHCNNYLQYDIKWCKASSGCQPVLREEPSCSNGCCPSSGCPPCERWTGTICQPCLPQKSWNVISCDSISLV